MPNVVGGFVRIPAAVLLGVWTGIMVPHMNDVIGVAAEVIQPPVKPVALTAVRIAGIGGVTCLVYNVLAIVPSLFAGSNLLSIIAVLDVAVIVTLLVAVATVGSTHPTNPNVCSALTEESDDPTILLWERLGRWADGVSDSEISCNFAVVIWYLGIAAMVVYLFIAYANIKRAHRKRMESYTLALDADGVNAADLTWSEKFGRLAAPRPVRRYYKPGHVHDSAWLHSVGNSAGHGASELLPSYLSYDTYGESRHDPTISHGHWHGHSHSHSHGHSDFGSHSHMDHSSSGGGGCSSGGGDSGGGSSSSAF